MDVQTTAFMLQDTVAQFASYSVMAGSVIIHGCRACMNNMTASIFHFDLYVGLSCGAMLQAWHACRTHRHEQAREHGMNCFVHAIAALLQWHA